VSEQKRLKHQRVRRTYRVRNKFRGIDKKRITVFRSRKQIYVQIIDDSSHATLVAASSLSLKGLTGAPLREGDKRAIAKQVGLEAAKIAKEKSIESVFFDRGPYRYHGRVRALAEGLREGGLKF
jgi:large subunit ribosomal protein L18